MKRLRACSPEHKNNKQGAKSAKGDREKAMKMLDRYIKYTHDGKMYGEWNDKGRLLDY